MRSLAVIVPRERAEDARRELLRVGRLRTDVGIVREGTTVVIPVTSAPAPPLPWGELGTRELPSRTISRPSSYRDLLPWPPEELRQLPRSFDVVGDIVVIRIPPELESRAEEIGSALLRFVPGARRVGADSGVHGPERLRTLRSIAGNGSWKTRHRENGIDFEIDLEVAYFSPRLGREHARVAGAVRPGDRVLDLCCGVGPFALTIGRDGRAESIRAVDSNPRALDLLDLTQARLSLSHRVETIRAPLEEFLPSVDVVDRAILNLPHEGIKYLSSVAATLAPQGALHYYEVTPRSAKGRRPEELLTKVGGGTDWSISESHVVHPYSPSADLMAFTLVRGPN